MQQPKTFEELENRTKNFNFANYKARICKNIKKFRKELYEENDNYYKTNNLINPYSVQNIAELLDISYEYYKRIESFDKTKPISLKIFLKIVELFDIDIEEFFR